WNGDKISERIAGATVDALEETADACVLVSAAIAPRDTGFMASTLERRKPFKRGKKIVIKWGNWTAEYTIWVEIGTTWMMGRYFMRRTQDQEYPRLAGRIKRNERRRR